MNKKIIDKEAQKYTSRLIVRLTPQLHKERAMTAAAKVGQQHGWKDAQEVSRQNKEAITNDCLSVSPDGTYLLIRTFKEKQNEQEKLKGTFQVLDGNILMLVHPASGTIYSIR